MLDFSQLRAIILSEIVLNKNKRYNLLTLKKRLGLYKTKELLSSLNDLINDGLVKVDNGFLEYNKPVNIIKGEFHANDKGFGFVNFDPENKKKDIFIPPIATNYAIDGDIVKTLIIKSSKDNDDRGDEGVIIEILSHKITRIVGEFIPFSSDKIKKTGRLGIVINHQKKLDKYSVLLNDTGIAPQQNDVVVAEITNYLNMNHPDMFQGICIKNLGYKGLPGVDVDTLIEQHDINVSFSEDTIEQIANIPDNITEKDRLGRYDLTNQMIITIDGDDSKDFDDAVTVWKLKNGNFHLGVHIADVSHYVLLNTPLDTDAYNRGTSIYLTDRVIPMLPFKLSNGICSLNPNVDRLTLSCEMEINPNGEVVDHKIFPSVIRSYARMTYNNVNKILQDDDQELLKRYSSMVPMLKEMEELHNILSNMRHSRGAIDFEEDEAKIICNEKGRPIDIVLQQRGIAEKMIESFMLIANETVAEHFYKLHVPFIYRVHETPDEDKLNNFLQFISGFGIITKNYNNSNKSKMLQNILNEVSGTSEETLVTTMALRSMKQAHYSPELVGHFGLAAKYYTHFTSPIRRYPDLFVHRMIHSYLDNISLENKKLWKDMVPEISEKSSMMERIAIDTERDEDDLKKAEYMEDKIGQEFMGIVNSTTSFGMFITLPNTVEGLIHISSMKDDYYNFVEDKMMLVGEHTNRTFKIGQSVRVKVERVNVDNHEIDFSLVTK